MTRRLQRLSGTYCLLFPAGAVVLQWTVTDPVAAVVFGLWALALVAGGVYMLAAPPEGTTARQGPQGPPGPQGPMGNPGPPCPIHHPDYDTLED